MGPDSASSGRRTRARMVTCHFMKALGQLMMLMCDCLIAQRMAQGGGLNLIVSLMCPIFHIHVAILNLLGAIPRHIYATETP